MKETQDGIYNNTGEIIEGNEAMHDLMMTVIGILNGMKSGQEEFAAKMYHAITLAGNFGSDVIALLNEILANQGEDCDCDCFMEKLNTIIALLEKHATDDNPNTEEDNHEGILNDLKDSFGLADEPLTRAAVKEEKPKPVKYRFF